MFPNVRLLIAAMVASVVALSCGFGVFAAFRVHHEPLARLPSATAPMQLLANNAASLSMMVAAVVPFDRRGGVPEPGTAETPESTGAIATPMEPSASTPGEPIERPVMAAAASIASDDTAAASAPERKPEPSPASASDASASTSPQDAQAEAGHEAKPDGAAAANAEPALAPAPQVAVEAPTDPSLPSEETRQEIELAPASDTSAVAESAPEPTQKTATKKKKARTHVGAKTHLLRSRASTVAQSNTQYFTSVQSNFQTGPQVYQAQPEQRSARKVRHTKITARVPAQTNSATGGPFVSPTRP
jgi:hypothetical protein